MKTHSLLRRATLGLALAAALLLPGCYGRFTLTRSIYQWNHDVTDDRYLRSMIFIPMSVIYLGAAVIDALVINVLEFWSGDKVVDEAALPDGSRVKMASAGNGAPLIVTVERDGQTVVQRQLVRLGAGHFDVRDAAGHELGTLSKITAGKYEMRDAAGKSLSTTTPLQAITAI